MEKLGWIALAVVLACSSAKGYAQSEKKKVSAVKIYDADNRLAEMPQFGKKHLLIFYVDPDHANQNKEFREDLEKNQINSDDIYGFGIVNLKDAPLLPNSIVRAMVRKKVKQTGAAIYTDPDNLLSKAWGLGDCNDKFVLLFVTKEGRIEFMSKGEMTQPQIDEFWRVIDKYR
ncbi:YtfJ family protein [uncultured Alistipes sp.]|uniref:YtfJ family protein n=1 Tax=uncultured Alistipes sp. TaxID=538949 RepID=UPI002634D256|nr:YtfJ family protein [uncultured Alistipes sp.]